MTGPDLAIQAAQFYPQLRAKGITIRSSIDLIIGTYCIVNDHELLQRDRDFASMQRFLGLRLV